MLAVRAVRPAFMADFFMVLMGYVAKNEPTVQYRATLRADAELIDAGEVVRWMKVKRIKKRFVDKRLGGFRELGEHLGYESARDDLMV
jgi:hypothetical protein